MMLKEQVGHNIGKARRQAGLTQTELAYRLGTASQDISRIETGRVCPRLTTLLRVARAIEIPLTDLLDGIE